ncbi:MAG: hypothetical protein IPO08_24925 [Xanthomonadales bacterium]|nr:hypothetical protein [Xanthomonadales bacterium]
MKKSRGPGFCITSGKGFHVRFENGYVVSVQFGPGNYCDNYNMDIGEQENEAGAKGSSTAETAVWGPDGEMIDRGNGDTVQAHQAPDAVLRLLNWAAEQESTVRAMGDER